MPYYEFIWSDEIVDHLAQHGVSPKDFEQIVSDPEQIGTSRSSGNPCAIGQSIDGRMLFCV